MRTSSEHKMRTAEEDGLRAMCRCVQDKRRHNWLRVGLHDQQVWPINHVHLIALRGQPFSVGCSHLAVCAELGVDSAVCSTDVLPIVD